MAPGTLCSIGCTLRVYGIGRYRSALRSPVCISSPRTSTAPPGASSRYKIQELEPPGHGLIRSLGGLSRKVDQLVNGHGLPMAIVIPTGHWGDSPMLLPLLSEVRLARQLGHPRTPPERVSGDKAHSSRAIRQHLSNHRIESAFPEPCD